MASAIGFNPGIAMASRSPTAKVISSGVGGVGSAEVIGDPLGVLLVFFLGAALGEPLPEHVASAIRALTRGVVGVVVGIMAGWYTPPSLKDVAEIKNGGG